MVDEMCTRGGGLMALLTAVVMGALAWFLRWLGFDLPGASKPPKGDDGPGPAAPVAPMAPPAPPKQMAGPSEWPPSNLGALLLCLLLPSLASAEVKIDGPASVPAGKMARLSLVGAKPGAAVKWDVRPLRAGAVWDRELVGRDRLILTGEPGEYAVTVLAISGTVKDGSVIIEYEEAAFTLRIEGGAAPKPPEVPPKDPPKDPPPPGKADPRAALGRLTVGTSGCTCTVIGPQRPDGKWDILTAAHCWPSGAIRGSVKMPDGKVLAVRLAEIERSSDIAWMVTESPHVGLPYAVLAKAVPPVGTAIWHAGYGVDRPGNLEEGTIAGPEAANRQVSFDLNVSSGDSGGGIFIKATGEHLANVCCTRSIGRKTTMWGGSSLRAAELRPKAPASDPHEGCTHPTLDLNRMGWDGKEKTPAARARPAGLIHPILDLSRGGWGS